jgi:hypothetical protein
LTEKDNLPEHIGQRVTLKVEWLSYWDGAGFVGFGDRLIYVDCPGLKPKKGDIVFITGRLGEGPKREGNFVALESWHN